MRFFLLPTVLFNFMTYLMVLMKECISTVKMMYLIPLLTGANASGEMKPLSEVNWRVINSPVVLNGDCSFLVWFISASPISNP
jgi:hypothetical protein